MQNSSRLLGNLCLALILLAATRVVAETSSRRALVIGNSHYSHTDSLRNAESDASDMAQFLNALGFIVTSKNDVTKSGFIDILNQFQRELGGTDEIVFYYSGHGFQTNGANYLAPVDMQLSADAIVTKEAMPLEVVLKAIAKSAAPKVVLIDACRSNPFSNASVRRLARPEGVAANTLISFSTTPNNGAEDGSGSHSPYTRALLRMMKQPRVPVEDLLKEVRNIVSTSTEGSQVPWDESSLNTKTFLRSPLFVKAQIEGADDDVMVIINGEDLTSWGNDADATRRIPVHAGTNPFLIRVFNQRSYTGGVPYLGGHLPEGWNDTVSLLTDSGVVLRRFFDREDRPEDNGPRHGHWFTVVRGKINVDEDTAAIELIDVDDKAWVH